MAFPSVTETDLHAGTPIPPRVGILALSITLQGSRHFCTSLLQYSVFKPLPNMLHLAGWYATILSAFVFSKGRFSKLTPQDLATTLISISDRSCTSYLHNQFWVGSWYFTIIFLLFVCIHSCSICLVI